MPKVAIPALAGLLAGVLFLASNVAALHSPRPHGVKVAVAGAPAAAAALQRALGPAYQVKRVTSVEQAVRTRSAYAGLDVPRGRVVTASAGGYLAATTLQQALTKAAPKVGVPKPKPVDLVPLQSGDPRGQSLQQIVLGTIIGPSGWERAPACSASSASRARSCPDCGEPPDRGCHRMRWRAR